jgi:hypothetical protein
MSQKDVLQAIVSVVRGVTGIKGVPDYPPDQIPERAFPFAVAYPGNGTHTFGVPGEKLYLGEFIVEVHVARKNLPAAVQGVIDYGDSVPAALMDDIVSGNTLRAAGLDTFGGIQQTFGELDWGDMQTLGYRFIVTDAKIRSNL